MVIAFANQKGGTGKTTTTLAIATLLSKLGQKILVVDIDPQASATQGLMKFDDDNENSLFLEEITYRWFIDQNTLEFKKIPNTHIDLAPSSGLLSKAELELAMIPDSIDNSRAHRLKKMIDSVKDQYHHVLIDCPGNFGLLTLNGLCAADQIIVVTSVGKFERSSTKHFLQEIEGTLKQYNPDVNVLGVLLTMTDPYQITEKTRKKMQSVPEVASKLFLNEIPKNNAIRNATDDDQSIWIYDPFSSSAKAYIKLWEEVKTRLDA